MAAVATVFVGPGKVHTMDALGTWLGYTSLTLNTQSQIEGTGCLSEKVSATTIQGYGVTAADWTGEPWNFASGQANDGDHIYCWMYAYEGWDTLANGGFRIRIADDLATDSVGTWYVGPQPGFVGGWYCYVINPSINFNEVTAGTASWTTNGNPAQLTGVDGFGNGWKITKSITGNVDNCFMDSITVGKGYRVTGGDGADQDATFNSFASYENTNRFGALRSASGIIFPRCKLYIGGTGSENTAFTDSNFTVVWEQAVASDGTSSAVSTEHYALIVDKGTGTTNITLSNGSLQAVSPHEVYLDLVGGTAITFTNINVTRARLIDVDSAVSWTGGLVSTSGLLTLNSAATLVNLSFIGGSDTAQLKASTPSYFDNCSGLRFTSAGTGHAIEVTSTGTYTFNNFTFSGYAGSNGSTGNEAVYVNVGSGNVTINASTSFSVRTAGATVTLVVNAVSVIATVTNVTGTAIQGANVMVKATTGATLPVNAVVTITNSGTTATVSHTSHLLNTNDKVLIKGASHQANNGVFTITKINDNSYSYTMGSSPGSNPTGTIYSTYVALYGTTNASGQISTSRVYANNQPIIGWARSASGATKYKTGNFTGTISNTSGGSFSTVLIVDE